MKELFGALVKASQEIGGAAKSKVNPAFKSKYADLASVIDAVKEPLIKNGLTFVQKLHEREHGVGIETVLIHESGQEYSGGVIFVPATKHDAQGYGSAITYGKRYSLQSLLGVPSEDDDGNAAVASAPKISAVAETVKRGLDADPVKVARVVSALVDFHTEHTQGQDVTYGALETWEPLTNDEKTAVWNALAGQSKVRTWIKSLKGEKAAA